MRTAAVQQNYNLHYLGPIQPNNPAMSMSRRARVQVVAREPLLEYFAI
jgi:hypothetical protein